MTGEYSNDGTMDIVLSGVTLFHVILLSFKEINSYFLDRMLRLMEMSI